MIYSRSRERLWDINSPNYCEKVGRRVNRWRKSLRGERLFKSITPGMRMRIIVLPTPVPVPPPEEP